jgi:ketosteroid isomerase-like protein
MKTFFNMAIVTLILLIVFGFSQNKSDQLNQKQTDQIKIEVTAVFDSINAIYERKDANSALKYYSSDFVAYATNGQKFDLKGVMDQYAKGYETLSTYKWTTYKVDFIVVTKDLVVISVDGRNESILNSGQKLIFDPSHYTLAYKKVEGTWKFCYQHFSGKTVK